MKNYPYNSAEYDADASEWMAIYNSYGDHITDRAGIAKFLGLWPNRVSELTRAGHLQAASANPLSYAMEHNRSCYEHHWRIPIQQTAFLQSLDGQERTPRLRSATATFAQFAEKLAQHARFPQGMSCAFVRRDN